MIKVTLYSYGDCTARLPFQRARRKINKAKETLNALQVYIIWNLSDLILLLKLLPIIFTQQFLL